MLVLLDMPDEVLSHILGLVTRPEPIEYHPRDFPWTPRPIEELTRKLQGLLVCKRIYYLATDAHFAENWLHATISVFRLENRMLDWRFRSDLILRGAGRSFRVAIESGTFEKHELFSTRVRKLRLDIKVDEVDGVILLEKTVVGLVAKCACLGKLVVDLVGTKEELRDEMKMKIETAVHETTKTKARQIKILFSGEGKPQILNKSK